MSTLIHEQHGLKASLYQPLSEIEVKKVAEASFRVLEESGMAVHSPTALAAAEKAGAMVDRQTNIVRFPRSLIEDAIDSTPSSLTLYSRDGETDIVLEKNRVHYGTGGTAIYVLDPDTGERRPSTVSDVILNARMVQALHNIHLFTINVFPNDVKDQDSIDPNRFYHAFSNTTKHVMGGIYSLAGLKKVVEMAEMIAGGPEALRAKPFVSFITLIISPFKFDDAYGEMTCYLAQQGLPVVVPTEPICGTTAPITLAGNVLTHVAETLGGVVLTQCVRKGAPAICGSVGSITNLQDMAHVGGAIERAMINAAVSQLAQYFEIPLYSTGGTTDSKEVDIQSAYESAMSSLLVAMSGANYIHDIAGLMEADLTVSYDKLVMDNEILGMCQRVLRGIEITDDALATDLLIEKGPGGDYVSDGHTVTHMRSEFYSPTLANRDSREIYRDQDSASAQAHSFVESLRAKKPENLLGDDVARAILKRFPEIVTAESA